MSPLAASEKQSPIWKGFLILVFVGLAVGRIWSASYDDFAVYWRAGKEALQGVSVYTEPGHYQFKYAPFTAISLGWCHQALLWLVSAVTTMTESFRPHGSAEGMLVAGGSRWVANLFYWIFLSGWLFWFLDLARRYSPENVRLKHFGFVMILLLQSLSEELNLGQVNLIPVILLVLVIRHLDDPAKTHTSSLLHGVALGIAVQFKLFSLIVYPLLAFRGRWLCIASSIGTILICNLALPGLMHGWPHAVSEFQAWTLTLTQSSEKLLYSGHNISWIGTIGKATGAASIAKISWGVLLLLFLGIQLQGRMMSAEKQVALNLSAILILNPLTWNYWMLFLAPLLFQTLAHHRLWIGQNPKKFAALYIALLPGFLAIFSPWSRNWVEPLSILILTIFWLQFSFTSVRTHSNLPVKGPLQHL